MREYPSLTKEEERSGPLFGSFNCKIKSKLIQAFQKYVNLLINGHGLI